MNLNALIETYKQCAQLETRLAGIVKEIEAALREEENLKKELQKINLELIRLREKDQPLQKDLEQETSKLEKIMAEIRQAGVTPQTLAELEKRYRHLESETRVLEEKGRERDTLLRNLASRLADPGLQAQLQRLCADESQLQQQVTLQKRLTSRKKKLEQNKSTLVTSLVKTAAAIDKLNETHRREIDSFLQYRDQSPTLEKRKTSLTKKEAYLTGKIQGLEKKLQNEAAPGKIRQLQEELENKKKELEVQGETRALLETKKQETTHLLDQETQKLDKIKAGIDGLETIAAELTCFLKERGITSPDQEGRATREETLEIIHCLKKYIRETVIPQDNRIGSNT
jgi:chromosome segregation ATPase